VEPHASDRDGSARGTRPSDRPRFRLEIDGTSRERTILSMGRPVVIDEDAFEVARVKAVDGPSRAEGAFDQLEARLDALRGRKMYGVFYSGDPEEYFACLRLDSHESDDLGFERATVPGGLYGRMLVRDWGSRISEFPQIFDQLQSDLTGAGLHIDQARPSIESYRRIDELVIMLPVVRSSSSK
jgi:hypothetical protein